MNMYLSLSLYIYIYTHTHIIHDCIMKSQVQATLICPLAIFYPPLKYLGGCVWLFCRLRREAPISQNWLKGLNMATIVNC